MPAENRRLNTPPHAPGRHKAMRRGRLRRVGAICAVGATTLVAALGLIDSRDRDPTRAQAVPTAAPERTVVASESAADLAPAATPPTRTATEAVKVPNRGPGTFSIAPVSASSDTKSTTITYTVEVETNLPFATEEVAVAVDRTLQDKRGWTAKNATTFARVAGASNTRILLATPATADRLCAPLKTNGDLSCRNGQLVVLNAKRWAEGALAYGNDVAEYRRYLVNHEVGHRLGRGHQTCPAPGSKAPLMLQQTKGLQGCEKNPWP